MYGSITPPEWYRNVIFGVLAHGLMSDTEIRAFGRWKSNAFLRYIRPSSLGIISPVPT